MTRCMNCETTQGPFERKVLRGPRNIVLIGCPRGQLVTIDGKSHYAGTNACAKRRLALDNQRYGVTLSVAP